MLSVVALGGNALARRDQRLDVGVQRANVEVAAATVAEIAASAEVVVTHGNGPQVGLLALQNEAYGDVPPYPLDVLDAETEGMIGYLLAQELAFHLGSDAVATLLTQVVVQLDDPAFGQPSKPIGPVYDASAAEALRRERRWTMAEDGTGWRRVVASPDPVEIVELRTIRLLREHGVTVVCVGGGGIPVVRRSGGGFTGVEAVVDKDLASSLLASGLDADGLVLLTDVDGVYRGWGTDSAELVRRATPEELRAIDAPAGSMGPKVEAACRFVERGGRYAAIGSLRDGADVARGDAGTVVTSVKNVEVP